MGRLRDAIGRADLAVLVAVGVITAAGWVFLKVADGVTEGEPGQSLFVLTTGTVKVFVRDPAGRNVALCPLGEGAFFGEIATLSGRPRSATVTAASRCELLELDKATLDAILKVHPRVRDVLEEHYIARASDPEAAVIRGTKQEDPARGGPG